MGNVIVRSLSITCIKKTSRLKCLLVSRDISGNITPFQKKLLFLRKFVQLHINGCRLF